MISLAVVFGVHQGIMQGCFPTKPLALTGRPLQHDTTVYSHTATQDIGVAIHIVIMFTEACLSVQGAL